MLRSGIMKKEDILGVAVAGIFVTSVILPIGAGLFVVQNNR